MTIPHTYQECLHAMYGLRRFGIKLGLDTINSLLAGLGNPHQGFACIHVAGTNGKGSIASALSAVLHAAGYRVGLFTSPHLVRFNERIRIDTQPISDDEVVAAYHAAMRAARTAPREPTFFELSTAMALYAFARRKVSWAVIETGMGGRLDATNVITPALSIISNISLEHMDYLGTTLAEIAAEKGGIIKERVAVITAARQPRAVRVLRKIAEARQAPFLRLGPDFKVRRNADEGFTYFGLDHTWRNLRTRLAGSFQIQNAALVLAACELLQRRGLELGIDPIKTGLATHRWPGRLEVVSTRPYVLLDGAHNLAAAKALGKYLAAELSERPIVLVAGILDDKPYEEMLRALLPPCGRVILTRAENERALPPEVLLETARTIHPCPEVAPNVTAAVKQALATAGDREAVVVAGSLYVVGEAITALNTILPKCSVPDPARDPA